MFWTIAGGIVVGGVILFVIVRNWETVKTVSTLLLIGFLALALIGVIIGGVVLLGNRVIHYRAATRPDLIAFVKDSLPPVSLPDGHANPFPNRSFGEAAQNSLQTLIGIALKPQTGMML